MQWSSLLFCRLQTMYVSVMETFCCCVDYHPPNLDYAKEGHRQVKEPIVDCDGAVCSSVGYCQPIFDSVCNWGICWCLDYHPPTLDYGEEGDRHVKEPHFKLIKSNKNLKS